MQTLATIGGEIWLDPRVSLNHVGHYTFNGNVRKMLTGEARLQTEYVSPDQRPYVLGESKQQEPQPASSGQPKIQISKKK